MPWGQWASLRYTSFAGGEAVVDSKNIVCHVNSSACRVYVTSLYSTTSISLYKSFYTLRVFIYFLQLHFCGHFRTAKFLFYVYTHLRTLICGCTVVSTVLQLHFRDNFRVHLRTSTPTLICGRTATFLFCTHTQMWMYSGFYSATATFSRPFSCTFSYIHAYIHLWTHMSV